MPVFLTDLNLTSNLSKEQKEELLFYRYDSLGMIRSRIWFEFEFPIIKGKRSGVRLYQWNRLYSSSGLERENYY